MFTGLVSHVSDFLGKRAGSFSRGETTTMTIKRIEDIGYRVTDVWRVLEELTDDLDIEAVLIDHIPPQKRFLVDRWLRAYWGIGGLIEGLKDELDSLAETIAELADHGDRS
jgi:hypothetical protein